MSEILTRPNIIAVAGSKRKVEPSLETFFAPQSVVVIGASPKEGNLGKRIVNSIRAQGYSGDLMAVHPKGEALSDCPVYSGVNQLPESVDLAIAAVSATHVLSLLEPLAEKNVHHLIVVGGGFSETDHEGELLQNQLQLEAQRLGIRVIGPNGLGVFSAPDRFNSFFLLPGEVRLPETGNIGIISQSGAFMSQMLDRLAERRVGVRRAVNFGNRVDVGECDLLEMFGRDPAINTIALYLESMQDGQRWFRLAQNIAPEKKIVVCKGGHGLQGHKAARAHSAALAGSYPVFQTACRQAGIIEVDGLESLIDAVQVLSWQKPLSGDRILIVSNGGGMGVLLTDRIEQSGMSVPEPSRYYQDHLMNLFPDFFSFHNPVDLTGSGTNEQCALITEYLLNTREFDGLLLVLLSGTEGINPNLSPLLKERLPTNFPVVVGAYGNTLYSELRDSLQAIHVPVLGSGERAAEAMLWLQQAGKVARTGLPQTGSPRIRFFTEPTRGWLDRRDRPPHEMEIKQLLDDCGIPTPARLALRRRQDLDHAAERLGFPMVLKAVAPDIQHKTETGGIHLNVDTMKSLLDHWNATATRWPLAVWSEQQMPPGLELMVGFHRDPEFGPVLLFGTGGTAVEVYHDIGRLLLPATFAELNSLVRSTQAGTLIKGFRGQPPLALDRLLAFLQWTADWVLQEPRMASLDFNPVRLYSRDLMVLDAKLSLTRSFGKG